MGSGRSRESVMADNSTQKEPQLGAALAYDAATKALPPHRIPAMRSLFEGLSDRAEVDTTAARQFPNRQFLVLLLLLHDRLQREGAPMLYKIIQQAENRQTVTPDEFREAVRDAKVQAIDDVVWRPLLDKNEPGFLSTDLLLEYLGGGSQSRVPGATVSESGFMAAVTEAIMEDHEDRMTNLKSLWHQEETRLGIPGALGYGDFASVVKGEEANLPTPMLRALFLTSVELSRGCSQINGDPCLPLGTLQPVQGQYGGEVVTFKLFAMAALRCGLFLKDFSHSGSDMHAAGAGDHVRQVVGGRSPTSLSSSPVRQSVPKRGTSPQKSTRR